MSMAYNRTMLELKYVVASSTRRVSCAYNRTMLELKCIPVGDKTVVIPTYNRTMLELKFDNYGYVYGLMVL